MELQIRLITDEKDKRACEAIVGCRKWMMQRIPNGGFANRIGWMKHFKDNEEDAYNESLQFIKRVAISSNPVEITRTQYDWMCRIYDYVLSEILLR